MGLLKRLFSLLMFLIVAGLGGALVAGLAIPLTSLLADSGEQAVESLESLPVDLETPPMAERSRLLNADGSVLTYFYDENRYYVGLDKVSAIMQKAMVAIEDHRFYEHGPIDLQGTLRALVSTSQGVTQGASSITQQYVRLVLVDAAERAGDERARTLATENTIARKVRELRYAMALEQRLSKDEILERYLNMSYFGDGAYGVEAAARHYFGVSAKDLDLPQAAMLAGLVRNPVSTNPVSHPEFGLSRRADVLNRMAELGIVTTDQATAAKQTPFDPKKVREYRLGCANAEFPFICDYAWRTLMLTKSLGATPAERKQRVLRGGLTIQTRIDPKAQRRAEKVIRAMISPKDPVVSVIVMLEPGTGQIVAMAQSRPKMGKKDGQTFYNYAVNHAMGGADGYQGGSTFKAFVAAAALENGMGAYGVFDAKQRMTFDGQTFKNCQGPFKQRKWTVVNAGGTGKNNLFSGVKNSVNTYFAQLIKAVGVCEAVTMAKRLGLEMSMGSDLVKRYGSIPSFTLGAVEVTPLSMIEAYGTFANRGVHCEPVILKSIKLRDGQRLEVPSANCKRVLSAGVADAMNRIFQGPYNGGTATRAKVRGVQMAGKTGTVPDNKAIWTVGYTPELVAAAMISYDNNKKYQKFWNRRPSYLRYTTLPKSGTYLTGFSGGDAGQRLLKPAFAAAIKKYDRTRFHSPPESVLRGQWRAVPACTGMSVQACRSRLERAGFSSYLDEVDSAAAKGTVVGLDPSGKAPKLSSIAIKVSNGKKKEEPDKPKPDSDKPATEPPRRPPRR
ncbi:MAG: transglycosylase domain-containing protein [Propionicimonas sp.]|nr:transglycosylase domain-containing protein [Propionicimonas sp.]